MISKQNDVSNFNGQPKIPKSKIIESVINTQNSEIIETSEPNNLNSRQIVESSECPARKQSRLIDKLIKSFLKKHQKLYLR